MFEYLSVAIDLGNLKELNRFARAGWKVVTVIQDTQANFALLERRLKEPSNNRAELEV